MGFKELSEYNVVITSYGTLSTEYLPKGVKNVEMISREEGRSLSNGLELSWTKDIPSEIMPRNQQWRPPIL